MLLSDVAQVIESLENTKVGGWFKDVPAVIVDVYRQPGANVIETVQRLRAELPRLQRAMPSGVGADAGYRPHRHHSRVRA